MWAGPPTSATSSSPRVRPMCCWPGWTGARYRALSDPTDGGHAMFAGHIGAALAIGRAERRVNVGAFVAAALLLDIVLWVFVLLGWESVVIPANYAVTHQPEFVFPYSHGLLAALLWSLAAAVAALVACARLQPGRVLAAGLLAAAVFSHWLLDALVHGPELPLLGDQSTKVGLGLWQNMPVGLAVEAGIVVAGLALFLSDSALSRPRRIVLAGLCGLVLALTVLGMTVAPAPPSALAMAASSLASIAVVCALVTWLGRLPR